MQSGAGSVMSPSPTRSRTPIAYLSLTYRHAIAYLSLTYRWSRLLVRRSLAAFLPTILPAHALNASWACDGTTTYTRQGANCYVRRNGFDPHYLIVVLSGRASWASN